MLLIQNLRLKYEHPKSACASGCRARLTPSIANRNGNAGDEDDDPTEANEEHPVDEEAAVEDPNPPDADAESAAIASGWQSIA